MCFLPVSYPLTYFTQPTCQLYNNDLFMDKTIKLTKLVKVKTKLIYRDHKKD